MTNLNRQAQPDEEFVETEVNLNEAMNPLMHVVQSASLPMTVGQNHTPTIPSETRGGFLERVFGSAEDKRHMDVMKTNEHVTREALQAFGFTAALATDFFANAVEAEATMQGIIYQHSGSAMAMAAAPVYAQLARGMMTEGMTGIGKASIGRIQRKIESR